LHPRKEQEKQTWVDLDVVHYPTPTETELGAALENFEINKFH
jgi:hypothetical protein